MANYAKTNIGNEGRVELHEKLSLTGAESALTNFQPEQAFRLFTLTRTTKKSMAFSLEKEKLSSTMRQLSSHLVIG